MVADEELNGEGEIDDHGNCDASVRKSRASERKWARGVRLTELEGDTGKHDVAALWDEWR